MDTPAHSLSSRRASPPLRPFVRAYAQRIVNVDLPLADVPPRLEQILQFDLGAPSEVCAGGVFFVPPVAVVAGAFAKAGVRLRLRRGIETFAVFFRPSGFSQLFGVPVRHVTRTYIDAQDLIGAVLPTVTEQLAAARGFDARVLLMEQFLLARLAEAKQSVDVSANRILRAGGGVSVAGAAAACGWHYRQFERRFSRDIGMTPKLFARVARFQTALDLKLSHPHSTWRDIAHRLGYHDQMHMVHDFTKPSGATPTQLLGTIGDARPPVVREG